MYTNNFNSIVLQTNKPNSNQETFNFFSIQLIYIYILHYRYFSSTMTEKRKYTGKKI